MSLGEKAAACLRIAAARHGIGAEDACRSEYAAACQRWSVKAVERKFEELVRRGYLECGVSARAGWLTDKGRDALASYEQTIR